MDSSSSQRSMSNSASSTSPMLQRYLHESSLTDRLVAQANSPQTAARTSTLYDVHPLTRELDRISSTHNPPDGPRL
ncbi:hypothetical protein ACRE_005450 [Hapsidospora chrysogenum ATCC 11550]|uniref:Uncharacterized protein n=1 Tax=Hapsidospora chrysogenum (strain ATCC 11550 / CBS 779.69 / DSM 880 / IAM 14645 / JCM 23072 / IMI 49137) TaxID=857340 RepID=A0A086TGP5_HAPC1|nr:hypothetical protein ACRE_005450 [Hapsidospora chrysogenum ATCC 11550]